jgi:hypothetical protein
MSIKEVAENTLLKFVARVVIPPAATAAIAVAGYFLSQTSAKLDRLDLNVSKALHQQELTQTRLEWQTRARDAQITDIHGKLGDHETRLRVQERTRVQ